jgi:hypothetical protein
MQGAFRVRRDGLADLSAFASPAVKRECETRGANAVFSKDQAHELAAFLEQLKRRHALTSSAVPAG